jgi:hypothetical protein
MEGIKSLMGPASTERGCHAILGRTGYGGAPDPSRLNVRFGSDIDGGNLVAPLYNGVGEVQLSVEFERSRLNRQGP